MPWYDFSFHGETFFLPWRKFFLPWKIFFFPWKIFLTMEDFFLPWMIFFYYNHFVDSNDMVNIWEPQRGADGSLGAVCFLGLEQPHQPQGTDSPQAGRAGGLRLLAGGFLGLEPPHQHKEAPSEQAQQARSQAR